MDVRFATPDLRRLDELKTEALSVPFFADERPLRGALGLVDWRMCGMISRGILGGRVKGNVGDTLLLPSRARLPFEKVFAFGAGVCREFDESVFEKTVERMFEVLARAHVTMSTFVLPGRALGLIEPAAAMERFLGVLAKHPEHDQVHLVEDLDAQRMMTPIVERERRRALAL